MLIFYLVGVPKFYRFISERYPLINTKIENNNVPDIDNLYLDMNGVVHNCVRGNGAKDSEDAERYHNMLQTSRSNEDIFLDIFKYIDNIMSMIQPRKLIYFAIDGVAPRAKMNQQRSRRFRSARERNEEHKRRLAEDPMYVAADSTPFDSNCISPGTEFMQQLTDALNYYVNERLSSNSLWYDVEVVLSGAEAPGEGEHKIMEYIRSVKVGGKMAPNTRHCLYGLDADLIMLALVSHEPHFFLLREKVDFSAYWKKKGGPRTATHLDTITFGEFELLSIGLLREYLALDVGSMGNHSLSYFDVERVVDDFIFMLMLVGNDFLPHLPTVEIADGMVIAMMHLYKRLLPRLQGYLTESGRIFPDRVELFIAKLSVLELRAMKRKERERERAPRYGGTGPKTLFTSCEDLDTLWGFADVFANGSPYDIKEEIENCRKDTHSVVHLQKKRKYYSKKFGEEFSKDMDTSIDDLTTHYMQGIVWTLKYYFEGCQSWRWYYPFHYAPFPSDLISLENKCNPEKLSFAPDEPFLPLQQLMSVLPPASSACVPLPFRKLMTSPLSTIHDFYPEEFEADMNGKRNDWEAVVLLPFVDESRLLEAMSTIPQSELSPIEKRRNSLGKSIVLNRSPNNVAKEVKSPFPNRLKTFISCAKESPLELPTIPQGTPFSAQWVIGTHEAGSAEWVSDLPTLHPVPHCGKLDKISVNLFGYPSKHESLVVTLGSWKPKSRDFVFFDGVEDSPSPPDQRSHGSRNGTNRRSLAIPQNIDEVVHNYGIAIGSQVWTHFPWRNGGTVEAIIDESRTIRRASPPHDQTCVVQSGTNRNAFETHANNIAASLMDKGGVDIDKPKVLIEVLPHRSTSNSLFGRSATESVPLLFPVVTILSDALAKKEPNSSSSRVLKGISVDQKALFVGRGPFFGSLCEVKELLGDGNACIFFDNAREAARETPFGYDIVEKWQSQRWKPLSQVASRCGLPVGVANAFLGSVRVRFENGKDEIDLGLGIKYASRGLLIPGFAKVNEYGSYFFSEKTITLLNRYKETFPELFTVMDRLMHSTRGSKGAPVYEPKQLFPNVKNATEAVKSLASWVSASEVATQPLLPSSSLVLHRDAVFDLEKNAQIAKALQDDLSKQIANGEKMGTLFTVSQLQLRSGSEPLEWQNEPAMRNNMSLDPLPADGFGLRLGDRVVNRLAYTGTPLGLRGTVIGLHNQNSMKNDTLLLGGRRRQQHKSPPPQAVTSSVCTVEVVFDDEFIGGGNLNGLCNAGKGKAVPASSLYTIRPDRENQFYTANYARVSKSIKKRSSNWAENFHRGRAIALAAEETFRASIEPRSPPSASRAKITPHNKVGSPKPLLSFPPSVPKRSPALRTRNRQQIEKSVLPPSALSVEASEADDEAAILTARIKAALGISGTFDLHPVNESSAPASNSPLLQAVGSNGRPQTSPSSGRTPRKRGGRNRGRKTKALKHPAQEKNEQAVTGNVGSSESKSAEKYETICTEASEASNVTTAAGESALGFMDLWNQLKTQSNNHES